MPATSLHIRLIANRDAEPEAALARLNALSANIAGAPLQVGEREPYDKLGLYSDSVWSRVDASVQSLLALYEAITAVSPDGWREDEPDREETLREAIWDNRSTDEPLFDNAVAWAHVIVREDDA